MKNLTILWISLFLTSCAGMKVLKEPPQEKKSREGISMNGNFVNGGIQVQKVGFWCEFKHGILTFGEFGPTEEDAKAAAQKKCRSMFKDGPCELASCKPA